MNTLPETLKLPVTTTSPEIVPPVAENLALAAAKAALAYAPDVTARWSAVVAFVAAVFAVEYAELAYEPADVEPVDVVLAASNAD